MKPRVSPAIHVLHLVGFCLVLGLTTLLYAYTVRAGAENVAQLREEQEHLSRKLNLLTELNHSLSEGRKTLSEIENGRSRIKQRVPDTTDFSAFYSDLSESAALANVLVSEIQPGATRTGQEYLETPVSLQAVAPFENLNLFLFNIAQMPRLAKLGALSIKPTGQMELCEARLTLLIYAMPEERTR
ncbi:type 4a pilus biogenesis protein PilO [bacterium]|nr:type 4a pilus biogenesis protein PilO [bacterium]